MAYSELTIFVNQIIDQKGLSGLDDAVRDQLASDMEARLIDQINRSIVEAIPEVKLSEFEKLADTAQNDSAIQEFFVANAIDTQKIATDTMLRFKDLYLGKTS